MTDDTTYTQTPVSTAVVERVAAQTSVDDQSIMNALVELHPELLGRHARYERAYDYVTVDGTRAYRVTDDEWDGLATEFDFEANLATATRAAHTEQARLLFAKSVSGNDNFAPDESGVVISIDTAEQF